MEELCGGKEGFAGLRFEREREKEEGGGGVRSVRESSGVLKRQDI